MIFTNVMNELIQLAKKEGIKVFIIGIGTPEGAPIPQKGGGFLKSNSGELVISKLNVSSLQHIALETGGGYVQSVTGDLDLDQIYFRDIKGHVESQQLESKKQKLL